VLGLGPLVLGERSGEFYTVKTLESKWFGEGLSDVYFRAGTGSHLVSGFLKSGEIGAIFYTRDKVLAKAQDELDAIVFQFASAVNEIYQDGEDIHGESGNFFFEEMDEAKGAALKIQLFDHICLISENIAAGYCESVGDNRIALDIVAIGSQALMRDLNAEDPDASSRYILNESVNFMIGNVGHITQNTNRLLS